MQCDEKQLARSSSSRLQASTVAHRIGMLAAQPMTMPQGMRSPVARPPSSLSRIVLLLCELMPEANFRRRTPKNC